MAGAACVGLGRGFAVGVGVVGMLLEWGGLVRLRRMYAPWPYLCLAARALVGVVGIRAGGVTGAGPR